MRILWCQEHNLPDDDPNNSGTRCMTWEEEPDPPCRMVPMRLIPDNALVIERELNGEWPESAIQTLEQYHYPCPPGLQEQVIKWLPTDVLDILAGADGETP